MQLGPRESPLPSLGDRQIQGTWTDLDQWQCLDVQIGGLVGRTRGLLKLPFSLQAHTGTSVLIAGILGELMEL